MFAPRVPINAAYPRLGSYSDGWCVDNGGAERDHDGLINGIVTFNAIFLTAHATIIVLENDQRDDPRTTTLPGSSGCERIGVLLHLGPASDTRGRGDEQELGFGPRRVRSLTDAVKSSAFETAPTWPELAKAITSARSSRLL